MLAQTGDLFAQVCRQPADAHPGAPMLAAPPAGPGPAWLDTGRGRTYSLPTKVALPVLARLAT